MTRSQNSYSVRSVSTMRIFVVIPNWNGADLLAECLASLEKQSHKASVVVVDNGSTDESVVLLEAQFPKVHLIQLDHNSGFTGGVNTGIEYALAQEAEAVALLNNDAVADKDWLAQLIERLKTDDEIGIVTSKMLRMDKKHLDDTGDFYTTRGMPFPRGRNEVDKGQYDTAEPVFSASGGASLYRAAMLQEVGLFDQDFFAYFEDVDLSFRARLAGWGVWYEPAAVVYHHVNATSDKLGNFSRYHSIKNFIYTYNKNMPGRLFWKYKPLFFYQLLRMGLGALRDGHLLVYMKAVAAALLKAPSILSKRHQIQKSRQITPETLDKLLTHGRPPRIPTL